MRLCYIFGTRTVDLAGAISNLARHTTKPEWIQLVGRWNHSYYMTSQIAACR